MLSYHRIIVICVFLTKLVCNNSQLINLECDWSVEHQQCPVYGTTDWDCLQSKLKRKLNCTNEEKYHCVRNERGKWVEVCDKGEVCAKGQEPVYSKDSRIECRNCSDPERYEPVERKPSYKFSECRRKKTTCPKDSLECPDENAKHIQNRKCRCMYEKDFIPQGYDITKDVWKCADSDNLICVKEVCPESVNGKSQSRGADYRCSPITITVPFTPTPTETPVKRSSIEAVQTFSSTPTTTNHDGNYARQTVIAVLAVLFGCSLLLLLLGAILWIYNWRKVETKSEPPGVPVEFQATSVKFTLIDLKWQPPKCDGGSKLTGFVLAMKEHGKENWTVVKKITIQEEETLLAEYMHQVTGLSDGTTYLFRVAAKNKEGVGGYLTLDPAITTQKYIAPEMPGDVAAEFIMENKCIRVSWSEPAYDGGQPVEHYLVEYMKTGEEDWLTADRIKITECEVNKLEGGMKYRFRVSACNAKGYSDSQEAENPVTFCSEPGKPNNVSCTKVESEQVTLTWAAPMNVGGLKIKWYYLRKRQEGVTGEEDISKLRSTTIRIIHLTRGKGYWFGVCAENDIGKGGFQYTDLVKLPPGPPDPPFGKLEASEIGYNDLILSWQPPAYDGGSPLMHYIVGKKDLTARFPTWSEMPVSLEFTSYHVKELRDGTKYLFKVSASNAIDTSQPIEGKFETTTAKPPGPPSGKLDAKEIGHDELTLSWQPPSFNGGSPLKFYNIKRKEINKTKWSDFQVSADFTTFHATQLKAGVEYYFRVSASNEKGNGEAVEATFITKFIRVPSKPVGPLIAEVGYFEVTLSWSPPEDSGDSPLQSYVVEEKKLWSNSTIAVVKPDQQKYRVHSLKPSTGYFFLVFAVNEHGKSEPLPMTEKVYTKPLSVPHKPSGPLIEERQTNDSLTLSWLPPDDNGGLEIVGYHVEHFDVKNEGKVSGGFITGLEWTQTNLQKDAKYVFRVRAKNNFGISDALEYIYVFEAEKSEESPLSVAKEVECPTAQQRLLTEKMPDHLRKRPFSMTNLPKQSNPALIQSSSTGRNTARLREMFENQSSPASLESGGSSSPSSGYSSEHTTQGSDTVDTEEIDWEEEEWRAAELLKNIFLEKSSVPWEEFIHYAPGPGGHFRSILGIPGRPVEQIDAKQFKAGKGDMPREYDAYEIMGEDSFLFRSVSCALFGNENFSYILRLLALIEGIISCSCYAQQYFKGRDVEKFIESCITEQTKEKFTKNLGPEDDRAEIAVQMAAREMAMSWLKCNPLQVQFLSDAINMPILQYFEGGKNYFGESVDQYEMVKPLGTVDPEDDIVQDNRCVCVLWVQETKLKKHKSKDSNYIVPVIRKKTK